MLARRTLLLLAISCGLSRAQDLENPTRKIYSVAGEVTRPGQYELHDGMRVFEALNNTGGFRSQADRKRIAIVRGNKRYYFDYDAYLRGERIEQNIPLEDGDTVVVK
jgi:protein involved in polysaccharide export with SLBB domain